MADTWILVADRGRARIFARDRRGRLVEHGDFICCDGRLAPRDAFSDRPGRFGAGPRPGRGDPRSDWIRETSDRFALQLGEVLVQALRLGRFDRLVLVAAPQMLGVLRDKLPQGVLEHVSEEIARDYTLLSPHDLSRRLEQQAAA